MNLNLTSWLRPRGASLDELQQQLSGAKAAHVEASEAVTNAREAFYDQPGNTSAAALMEALEGEKIAAEHVGRAEHLLAEAKAKSDAEERAKLLQRHAELNDQLSATSLQKLRAPTFDAEISALKAVIEARIAREQVEDQIGSIEGELKRVRIKLGESTQDVYASQLSHRLSPPSTHDVYETLANEFKRLGVDDPRMRLVFALNRFLNT